MAGKLAEQTVANLVGHSAYRKVVVRVGSTAGYSAVETAVHWVEQMDLSSAGLWADSKEYR
jgi:hypothetical protein